MYIQEYVARGKAPPAMQDHSALKVASTMFIFGGCDYTSETCYNDVYSLDLSSFTWSRALAVDGKKPPSRGDLGLVYFNEHLIVLSGCELGSTCYNDVWEIPAPQKEGGVCGVGDNKCNGHGQCRNDKCVCDTFYSGLDCGEKLPCVKCVEGVCKGDGQCACKPGWRGPACDNEVPCAHQCNNRGKCISPNFCVCDKGWRGPFCTQCEDDEDAKDISGACSGHGFCRALLSSEQSKYYVGEEEGEKGETEEIKLSQEEQAKLLMMGGDVSTTPLEPVTTTAASPTEFIPVEEEIESLWLSGACTCAEGWGGESSSSILCPLA